MVSAYVTKTRTKIETHITHVSKLTKLTEHIHDRKSTNKPSTKMNHDQHSLHTHVVTHNHPHPIES